MQNRKKENHYNIMTSCDDNLAPYVAVQLTAMAYNLNDAAVDFYLFHSRISRSNIHMLETLCKKLNGGMITFHEVVVPEEEAYEELARFGGCWCGAAYYSLCAHLLLPESVDRILYLDAGDTLVLDDIDPYYSGDFQGKSILATGIRFKVMNDGTFLPFDENDLGDREALLSISGAGVFNSGSYVMNLQKMREDGRTLADYQYLARKLHEIIGSGEERSYYGDQGLLAVAFVGDVQYYGYPEIQDFWYMPYNFGLWYYDRKKEQPPYRPAILHYCAAAFKPWEGIYPICVRRFQNMDRLHSLHELKFGQAEYYYLWNEYALLADRILTQ